MASPDGQRRCDGWTGPRTCPCPEAAGSLPGGAPAQDITYSVTVNDVMVQGSPQAISYDVTVIDPSVMVSVVPTTWGAIKNRYLEPEPATP